MPPKRKELPKDSTDPVKKPTKSFKATEGSAATEKKKTAAAPTPAPKSADFGSAFASLFEPIAPTKPAPTPTTTDAKKAPTTTNSKSTGKDNNNKKADAKKVDTKKPEAKAKEQRDALGRGKKELAAATNTFQQAKEKQREKRREEQRKAEAESLAHNDNSKKKDTQLVVTAQRNEVEAKMKQKHAMLQKQKEKEKDLLLEKDHVKPEFNDLEKKISRLATKGVVTLFNAVYQQQAKLEEIRANKSLTSRQQDQLIDTEAQQGFLDLLKQSATSKSSTKPDFEAVVPSQKKALGKADKKREDMKKKEEFDFDELEAILGDDIADVVSDADGDDEEVDVKKAKSKAKTTKKTTAKSKQQQQKVPDFLQDDYVMKKRTMKDWENDSDSSAEDL